jgi:hypothetical protein
MVALSASPDRAAWAFAVGTGRASCALTAGASPTDKQESAAAARIGEQERTRMERIIVVLQY